MSELDAVRKIKEVIVGAGGQASITFSDIPGTYRSLRLEGVLRGDTAANFVNMQMQFNGDTAANYDYQFAQTHGSTVGGSDGFGATSADVVYANAASSPANSAALWTCDIPNYSSTAFNKAFSGLNSLKQANTTGSFNIFTFIGEWRSTAAITSILLFPVSGNFVSGSIASLYGVL